MNGLIFLMIYLKVHNLTIGTNMLEL